MTASFEPAWWCRGPHEQTVWGSVVRPVPAVSLRRERWETPDGDFLDLDLVEGPPGSPMLIVLHGLEGSSRSKPVLGLLAAAQRKGWRGAGLNFRSCSGEMNRARRFYHAGETSDLAWVIGRLIQKEPGISILCAGFSLGGNVLLKYLGEQGEAAPVKAAAAISTPFDLAQSAKFMERAGGRIYMARLVRSLRQKTLRHLEHHPDLVDREAVLAVKTLEEFDEAVTAPLHGFASAAAYWAACSSGAFLGRIRKPALLISAEDDPFLPAEMLPRAAVAANRFLTARFTPHGGHVGFLAGSVPGRPIAWAEEETIRFLEEHAQA